MLKLPARQIRVLVLASRDEEDDQSQAGNHCVGSPHIYVLRRRGQPSESRIVRVVRDYQQQPREVNVRTTSKLIVNHLKLPFYQIKARDHLRYGMFNLQPCVPRKDRRSALPICEHNLRIHLHKEEFVRIFIEYEFNGARTNIVNCFRRGNGLGAQICSQLR